MDNLPHSAVFRLSGDLVRINILKFFFLDFKLNSTVLFMLNVFAMFNSFFSFSFSFLSFFFFFNPD